MKYFIAIFLYLSIVGYSQTGGIRGTITDSKSSTIPGVNIILLDTNYGTSSNEDGTYSLKSIPIGDYKVKFSAIGYSSKIENIEVYRGRILQLNIKLEQTEIQLQDVEVTGLKRQSQKDPRTSLIDLSPRSAKVLPGAAEDVFRTLQTLPGVLAPNDFSSQLIVRGSGPDQNLIIMDDIEIFNPYRLYGVISMFNPDAVSDVNLITGGFPAKYGDRLSAVLDVTNREGSDKNYLSGSLNTSIVDANLVLEGKNPFNLHGSWIVDSRRTYYDLIVEPFVKKAGLVEDNVSFPNFYDIQSKLVIGPYDGNKFIFDAIYSRDGVNVVSAKNRKTADSIGVSNTTRNDVFAFAWHYAPTKNYLNKFIVSWYRNGGLTDFNSEILDPSLNRNNFKNIAADTLAPYLLYFKFNNDFSFKKYAVDDKFTYLWGENVFEAGAGIDFLQNRIDFNFSLDPQLQAILNANPNFKSSLQNLSKITSYKKYHAYLENSFTFNNKFTIQPGIRFDYYDILNKAYLAPRISASYALDKLTTLRAVWGLYFQSPGYEKIRDQNTLYDLSDIYTNQLNAEQATHYVLGIERWLTSEWNVRIEGYYKDFRNLINPQIVSGNTYVTERIPGKDPRYSSGWTHPGTVKGDSVTQIPVNNSVGESYGIEFFLSKKNIANDNRLSGWISYSFAFANMFENGKEYPFRFDQRNTVNIVLNYKLNNWLDLGLRWQYGSGFPYTEPVGIKPRIILVDKNNDGIPETPEIATRKSLSNPDAPEQVIFDINYGNNKLNARKPPYHRLDIRFTAFTNFWNMDWSFYLDVVNVYNRKNVIGYNYFVSNNLILGREANNMFPIIPTFGFSMKF